MRSPVRHYLNYEHVGQLHKFKKKNQTSKCLSNILRGQIWRN